VHFFLHFALLQKEKQSAGCNKSIYIYKNNDTIWNAAWELLTHPLYLPDLAPSDFYSLPKLNKFADDKDIICMAHGAWKSKVNISSPTKSQLWSYAESSAFQLQETTLKSDKTRYSYHAITCNCVRI